MLTEGVSMQGTHLRRPQYVRLCRTTDDNVAKATHEARLLKQAPRLHYNSLLQPGATS